MFYYFMHFMDDKYVLSESDDINKRVWKAGTNDSIKTLNKRDKNSRNYNIK